MKSQIRRICLCVFFLCPCVLVSIETFAKEKTLPKWEVGFLMAGQYANEYRGSAKLNSNVVAAPFVYYRGDIVKVDRGGARAEFISADRF